MQSEIVGVEIKELKTHSDERGYFREVIRSTDGLFPAGSFQQWSHSRMQRDVVKAWHYHHIQTDWWYLAIGTIRTVLIDNRPESPTFRKRIELLMGDGPDARQICVRIPPGVLHGCRVLSDEAHLLYITSTIYNPNEEGRIPFDSSDVGYDWGPNALVVDNDRRLFEPTSPRVPVAA